MGTPPGCNVSDQRADAGSVLSFARDVIAIRRSSPDLLRGDYRSLPSPPGVWAWQRGGGFATLLNLGPDRSVVDGVTGTIVIGTARHRDGRPVGAPLVLEPSEGVLVRLG